MLLKINHVVTNDNLQRRRRKLADKVGDNIITRTDAADRAHRRQYA